MQLSTHSDIEVQLKKLDFEERKRERKKKRKKGKILKNFNHKSDTS
jgi:hypothetical protein